MEHLLIKLLIRILVRILQRDLLIGEEHEVIDKDFGCLFQCILGLNGTIRSDFDNQLVVVGLLLNTIRLD